MCVERRTHGSEGAGGQQCPLATRPFHATEEGIKKAKTVLEAWIQDIGLELKPSKTKITHTFLEYQGNVGFDFLG